MGLDAVVYCRCWHRGRTTPAPVPVAPDEEDGGLPRAVHEDDWPAVWAWMAAACEHRGFEVASERIGNWSAVRHFQEGVAARGGAAAFPVLAGLLPEANGGTVPPDQAAAALAELDLVLTTPRPDRVLVLLDADRGVVVRRQEPLPRYPYLLGPGYACSVEAGVGFTVRGAPAQAGERPLRFASRAFRQEPDGGGYLLVDDTTGARERLPVPADGDDAIAGPRRFTVVDDPDEDEPEIMAAVADGLRSVLEASVSAGSPVMWC